MDFLPQTCSTIKFIVNLLFRKRRKEDRHSQVASFKTETIARDITKKRYIDKKILQIRNI